MKTIKTSLIFGKKQIILASLVLILSAAVYLNWQFANNEQGLTTSGDPAVNNTTNLADTMLDDETGLLVEPTGAESEIPSDDVAKATNDVVATGEKSELSSGADTANQESVAGKVEGDKSTSTASQPDKEKNLGDALLVNAKTVADETYFAMARLSRNKANDTAVETLAGFLQSDKLTEGDKKDLSSKALALTDRIEAENRIENLIMAKGFNDCVVYLTQDNANVVVRCDGLTQDSATQIKNIIVSEGKILGEKISITEIN